WNGTGEKLESLLICYGNAKHLAGIREVSPGRQLQPTIKASDSPLAVLSRP
ncbi:hypothetical protein EVAR_21639_1, partial [Eumeta japonica]